MPQTTITQRLFDLLDAAGVPHQKLLHHAPSRTSAESRAVRRAASGLETTGAKALVQKLTLRDKRTQVAIFVLPGEGRFDSDCMRRQMADVKRARFLTADEVREATSLEVGAIPPFGNLLFPAVDRLYFDPALLDCPWVGFNAASHEHSVVMRPADLVAVAQPDEVFRFSAAAGPTICDEISEARGYSGL